MRRAQEELKAVLDGKTQNLQVRRLDPHVFAHTAAIEASLKGPLAELL